MRRPLMISMLCAGNFILIAGAFTQPNRAAEEIDKISSADAMKIAKDHWERLRNLQKQHRDALVQLQKLLEKEFEKLHVGEQLTMMSRVAHAELDMADTYAEREEACRKFVRELDRFKQAIEKKSDHSETDLLMIKSAWLSFEVELERHRFDDRSPEEVQALMDQAEATSRIFTEIFAKSRAGARGGEQDKLEYAGWAMCSRNAELLFALGKREAAVEQLKQACDYADRRTKATQAAYEAGTVTLDLVLTAESDQANAWMALAKRDRKAAADLRGK